MKLSGISRLRSLESQIRDQFNCEADPAINEMTSFVSQHYTTNQCGKISDVFHYDVWGGLQPSPDDYELTASIWDVLPGRIRSRLLDLDSKWGHLKSFGTDNVLERLGAYKRVEGADQSAPPSIG